MSNTELWKIVSFQGREEPLLSQRCSKCAVSKSNAAILLKWPGTGTHHLSMQKRGIKNDKLTWV